jgi:hypothetical protein
MSCLARLSAISTLISYNVTVAVGVVESWEARNTRLDTGWAAVESGGVIGKEDAVALGSTSLYELLGVRDAAEDRDVVATVGGGLFGSGDLGSKVVVVVLLRRAGGRLLGSSSIS